MDDKNLQDTLADNARDFASFYAEVLTLFPTGPKRDAERQRAEVAAFINSLHARTLAQRLDEVADAIAEMQAYPDGAEGDGDAAPGCGCENSDECDQRDGCADLARAAECGCITCGEKIDAADKAKG